MKAILGTLSIPQKQHIPSQQQQQLSHDRCTYYTGIHTCIQARKPSFAIKYELISLQSCHFERRDKNIAKVRAPKKKNAINMQWWQLNDC